MAQGTVRGTRRDHAAPAPPRRVPGPGVPSLELSISNPDPGLGARNNSPRACSKRCRRRYRSRHERDGCASRRWPPMEQRERSAWCRPTPCPRPLRRFQCRARRRIAACGRSRDQIIAGTGDKVITDSAASTMWRIRTRSSGRILNLGESYHLIAKMSAQILSRAQIDSPAAKQRRQLGLDLCQS